MSEVASRTSLCAVEQADAAADSTTFECTSCAVRAYQVDGGIVELVNDRNVCARLAIEGSASTEESARRLAQALPSTFDI